MDFSVKDDVAKLKDTKRSRVKHNGELDSKMKAQEFVLNKHIDSLKEVAE